MDCSGGRGALAPCSRMHAVTGLETMGTAEGAMLYADATSSCDMAKGSSGAWSAGAGCDVVEHVAVS